MTDVERRIEEMGIALPGSPQPIANYVPAVQTGNLLFVAGLGPAAREDGTTPNGKGGQGPDARRGLRSCTAGGY